ncbi:DUF1638 domain-containing protein [Geobacter pelophilus]|uniref:DUF1638 domain-containing protein n=1 Tax=Geoanaerobacter pelophilus TaxID=60036 RepID=A0AAW4L661_9BACT|nr:DUF1638 domain-containing protein [Geoanaerobacter pelophilus]MBT0663681.1 DUF1638 domain-containing protein [Geoanaerobacter pelophilus]
MNPHTIWISCGVVRAEMEELHRRGLIDGELLFLDSMLHMDPPQLETRLTATLEQQKAGNGCLVMVYGDCSAHMLDLVRRFHVGRVSAINCAQLLVGRERYRQLMREEAFLVLPEWASRWEQIMKDELGLNKATAHDLMGENRGVLVYLDTGLASVPEQQLQEFSTYTGLPWRVEAVSLDTMLAALMSARTEALKEESA